MKNKVLIAVCACIVLFFSCFLFACDKKDPSPVEYTFSTVEDGASVTYALTVEDLSATLKKTAGETVVTYTCTLRKISDFEYEITAATPNDFVGMHIRLDGTTFSLFTPTKTETAEHVQPTTPGRDEEPSPSGDPEAPSTPEPCRHEESFLVRTAEAPATCTEAGSTASVYCRRCHTYLQPSEVIPALGHALNGGKICSRCHRIFPNGDYRKDVQTDVATYAYGTKTTTTYTLLTLSDEAYRLTDVRVVEEAYAGTPQEEADHFVVTIGDTPVSTADFTLQDGVYTKETRQESPVSVVKIETITLASDGTSGTYTSREVRSTLISAGPFTFLSEGEIYADGETYVLAYAENAFSVRIAPEEHANTFVYGDLSLTLYYGDYEHIRTFDDVAALLFATAKHVYVGTTFKIVGYCDLQPVEGFTIPDASDALPEDVTYTLRAELPADFSAIRVIKGDSTYYYAVQSDAIALTESYDALTDLFDADRTLAYVYSCPTEAVAFSAVYVTHDHIYTDTSASKDDYVVQSYDGVTDWYAQNSAVTSGSTRQPGDFTLRSYRYELDYFDGDDFATEVFFDALPTVTASPEGYDLLGVYYEGAPIDTLPTVNGIVQLYAVYENVLVTLAPTESATGTLSVQRYEGKNARAFTETIPALTETNYEKTVIEAATLLTDGRVAYEHTRYGRYEVTTVLSEASFTQQGVAYHIVLDKEARTGTVTADETTYSVTVSTENGVMTLTHEGGRLLYAASLAGDTFTLLSVSKTAPRDELGLSASEAPTPGATYYGTVGDPYLVGLFDTQYVVYRDLNVLFTLDDLVNYDAGYAYHAGDYTFVLKNGTLYFGVDLPLTGEEIGETDLEDLPALFVGQTLAFTAQSYVLTGDETAEGAYTLFDDVYYLYDGDAEGVDVAFTLTYSAGAYAIATR